jgi:hypothetical protein
MHACIAAEKSGIRFARLETQGSNYSWIILDVHPTVSLISSSPSPPPLFIPPFVTKMEYITVDHA